MMEHERDRLVDETLRKGAQISELKEENEKWGAAWMALENEVDALEEENERLIQEKAELTAYAEWAADYWVCQADKNHDAYMTEVHKREELERKIEESEPWEKLALERKNRIRELERANERLTQEKAEPAAHQTAPKG